MYGNPGGMMNGQLNDITTDDVSRINKAMKTKEFGNLMEEYLGEISDPNNREEYDKYLEQLEGKGELPAGEMTLYFYF